MALGTIAALVAGAGALASGIGSLTSAAQSGNSVDENKELMDYQQEKDLQNYWTQYNSQTPAVQKSLLEQAGINPAMLSYGDFTPASLGNVSIPEGASASKNSIASLLGAATQSFSQLSQSALNNAQVKNLEADKNLKESQTRNFDAQTATEDLLRNGAFQDQNLNIRVKEKSLDVSDAQIKQIESNLTKISAEVDAIKSQASLYDEQTNMVKKQQFFQDIQNKYADKQFKAQLSEVISNVAKNYSIIKYNDALVNEVAATIAKLNAETSGIQLANSLNQALLPYKVGEAAEGLATLEMNNDILSAGLETAEDLASAQQWMSMVSDMTSQLYNFALSFGAVGVGMKSLKFGEKIPRVGFK